MRAPDSAAPRSKSFFHFLYGGTMSDYNLAALSGEEKKELLKKLNGKRLPVLVSGVIAYLMLNMIRSSSNIILPSVIQQFSLTAAQAGLFAAIYNYFYAAVNLPIGGVIDVVKSRKIMLLSYALMTGALVLFAFSRDYSAIIVSRALMGLGAAGFFPAYTKAVASWVAARSFPKVSGWVMAAATVGGLLSATPLTMLITGVGMRNSMLVLAGICAVLFGIMLLIFRNDPGEVGLPSQDEIEGNEIPKNAKFKSTFSGVITVLMQPRVWAIVCSVLVSNIAAAGTGYAATWMRMGLGFDGVVAANVIMAGTVIGISGPFIQGFVSTRFGIKKSQIMYIVMIMATLTLFALFLPRLTPVTVILCNLPLNIGGGMAISTCQSLFRKNVTTRFYGTTVGLYNAVGWAIGSGVFVQLFARFIDSEYTIASFQKGYFFLLASAGVLAVVALVGTKDDVIPVFAGEMEKKA
jgi:sugar phosphate permease